MNPKESAVRYPVCGGPAIDVQFFVDAVKQDEAVTVRACEACYAYHPAALQDI
jgi:hypothetical protein